MKEIKLEKDELNLIINLLNSNFSDKSSSEYKLLKKLEKVRDKKPISVSSRKAKGRTLQYKVCELISQAINVPYDQHDDNSLIHSNEMGQAGRDIILRFEAQERFPFSIECKAQENLNISDWISQAKANEQKETDWMLVFKKHTIGTSPIMCMDFEKFLKFWKDYLSKEEINEQSWN